MEIIEIFEILCLLLCNELQITHLQLVTKLFEKLFSGVLSDYYTYQLVQPPSRGYVPAESLLCGHLRS